MWRKRNYIFFPPCGLSVLEVEVEWKVVSVFYVNFVWFFNISRLVLSLLILKKKERGEEEEYKNIKLQG